MKLVAHVNIDPKIDVLRMCLHLKREDTQNAQNAQTNTHTHTHTMAHLSLETLGGLRPPGDGVFHVPAPLHERHNKSLGPLLLQRRQQPRVELQDAPYPASLRRAPVAAAAVAAGTAGVFGVGNGVGDSGAGADESQHRLSGDGNGLRADDNLAQTGLRENLAHGKRTLVANAMCCYVCGDNRIADGARK